MRGEFAPNLKKLVLTQAQNTCTSNEINCLLFIFRTKLGLLKSTEKNINLIFFLVGSHDVRFGQRALLTFLLLINAQVQTLKHPKFYFVISIEKQSVSS